MSEKRYHYATGYAPEVDVKAAWHISGPIRLPSAILELFEPDDPDSLKTTRVTIEYIGVTGKPKVDVYTLIEPTGASQ